jgi:hypothetical protein
MMATVRFTSALQRFLAAPPAQVAAATVGDPVVETWAERTEVAVVTWSRKLMVFRLPAKR